MAAANLLRLELGQALRRRAGQGCIDNRTAARRDDRPGQRPRDRRHLADERLRGAAGRRAPSRTSRRSSSASTPSTRSSSPRRSTRTAGAEVVDLRESASRRAGHQARPLAHRPGGRAGRLGHPLRARRRRPRVRYRIDGVLSESTRIPRALVAGVISRIKIMADLDIAERRVPQDGRARSTSTAAASTSASSRCRSSAASRSSCASSTRHGAPIDLDKLGMVDPERDRFVEAFSRPHGAVLVTGPTGSGKTTTLYGALQMLNAGESTIITIEDPVEYELSGRQADAGQRQGRLHFATGLRSMMRADPDIIMVGEIRDRETAQIAVEAALTGHLVLSTLHTNDAPGGIARLIEMGDRALPRGQRRRLRRRPAPGAAAVRGLQEAGGRRGSHRARARLRRPDHDLHVFEAGGCARCGGTGYKGRVGLYEVMAVTEEIRSLAIGRALGRRDRRCRAPRRDAPPARRGPREGPRRADVVRRARARHGLSGRPVGPHPYGWAGSNTRPLRMPAHQAGRYQASFSTAATGRAGYASQAGVHSARDGPWKGSQNGPPRLRLKPTARRSAPGGICLEVAGDGVAGDLAVVLGVGAQDHDLGAGPSRAATRGRRR